MKNIIKYTLRIILSIPIILISLSIYFNTTEEHCGEVFYYLQPKNTISPSQNTEYPEYVKPDIGIDNCPFFYKNRNHQVIKTADGKASSFYKINGKIFYGNSTEQYSRNTIVPLPMRDSVSIYNEYWELDVNPDKFVALLNYYGTDYEKLYRDHTKIKIDNLPKDLSKAKILRSKTLLNEKDSKGYVYINKNTPSSCDETKCDFGYVLIGDKIFFGDEVIDQADADTFVFIDIKKGPLHYAISYDKNNIYYKGKKIEGANPKNFRFKILEDERHQYVIYTKLTDGKKWWKIKNGEIQPQ